MGNIIQTENIIKKFGNFTALNKVSIRVPEHGIYGLLGPNGAGKTTLLRLINQISLPDSGRILFNGRLLRLNDVHDMGYLPEERGLYKSMKVGEQALYLAQLKGVPRNEARKRLKDWFEKFDIGSWWNKKVQELSKGMAQKVQFIITVLHKPKLLIFDEPFSGFDPINAQLIKNEILHLCDQGASVIFSTHRMESVEELCEHIALIDKAEKILEGNVKDIKRKFETNTFEVGLRAKDTEALHKKLAAKFSVAKANFKSLEDDLKLHIRLKSGETSNELIRYLSQKAEIHHFVKVIPSVNEIFIRAVGGDKTTNE